MASFLLKKSQKNMSQKFQFQFIYLPEKKKYIYTDIQYITKMLFKDY